jgi:hypothetical protein
VQTVGTASAPIRVRVRNDGVRPTTVTALALGGNPEFALAEDGCSGARVGAGDACTVLVRFTPAATGPRTTTLTVATEAAFAPRTFTLSGAGFGTPGPVRPVLPAPHLAPPAPPPVRLATAQRPGRASTRFSALRVENLAAGSTVVATCRKGCSRTSLTRRNVSGTLSLASFAKRPLPVGTKITVKVTAPGRRDATLTLTVRARKAPRLESRQ